MTAMTKKKELFTTSTLVKIGVLGSLGGLLMLFEFPLPFAPNFMGVDLSDTPIMLSSMAMGPLAGVVTSFIKILVKLVLKPTSTGFIGELSNLLLSVTIALTVGWIYKVMKNRKGAIIAVASTVVTMSAVALISNAYFIYPAYVSILGYNMSDLIAMTNSLNGLVHDYWSMMFFMVVPFNVVKQTFVAFLTIILIRHVEPLLK